MTGILVSILISGGIIAVVAVLVIRAVKRTRLDNELPPDELYDGVPYDVYSGERGGFRGSFGGNPPSSFDRDRQ